MVVVFYVKMLDEPYQLVFTACGLGEQRLCIKWIDYRTVWWCSGLRSCFELKGLLFKSHSC